jgi:hypothetical protein
MSKLLCPTDPTELLLRLVRSPACQSPCAHQTSTLPSNVFVDAMPRATNASLHDGKAQL